jgi:hypothetical protein
MIAIESLAQHAALLLSLTALGASLLSAQVCRGIAIDTPGWFALNVGRAAESATTHGADISWQFDQGTFVFASANVTSYERSLPARGHAALGAGFPLAQRNRFSVCATLGSELERVGDLRVKRIPVGLAMGWAKPLPGISRGIGLTLEPFVVHQDERIRRFAHTSNFLSARTGVVYLRRGWLWGVTYEHAFDADARWNAVARVGFTFN